MRYQPGDCIVTAGNRIHQRLIKWRTCSRFNHVAIVIDEGGRLVEAVFPKARYRYASDYLLAGETFTLLRPNVPLQDLTEAIEWVKKQVGKKYDWRGILSFLLNRQVGNKSLYFCSELAYEFYLRCGVKLSKSPRLFTPEDVYDSNALDEMDDKGNIVR